MKEKILWFLWGWFYIVCASLGFLTDVSGVGKALLMLVSLVFFVPGFWLLAEARQSGNKPVIKTFRIISACWLGLTLVLLVANILSVTAPEAVGNVLHILLVIFSAPMFCGQYWLISLFLWACLLMLSLKKPSKK